MFREQQGEESTSYLVWTVQYCTSTAYCTLGGAKVGKVELRDRAAAAESGTRTVSSGLCKSFDRARRSFRDSLVTSNDSARPYGGMGPCFQRDSAKTDVSGLILDTRLVVQSPSKVIQVGSESLSPLSQSPSPTRRTELDRSSPPLQPRAVSIEPATQHRSKISAALLPPIGCSGEHLSVARFSLDEGASRTEESVDEDAEELQEQIHFTSPASTPVHVAHDATDALAADVASHGQRMNPLRLAEKRQRSIAMKQHESWSQQASKLDAESSPRERARADPSAAAGMAKPPPYSMLVTLSRDLLPATPHVTPAPLLAVRNDVAGAHAHKPDNEAVRWLRQVASETTLRIKPHRRRLAESILLKPMHEALRRQEEREQGVQIPEHEHIAARSKIFSAAIAGHIVPRVGQLDATLGHALDDVFQQLNALQMRLPSIANEEHVRANSLQAEAENAQAIADTKRREASRCSSERDNALAAKTVADATISRLSIEVAEQERSLKVLLQEREEEKELLMEARTTAREAEMAQREAERENKANFQKLLELRALYEEALESLKQQQLHGEEMKLQHESDQKQLEQMQLSEPERFDELRRENRDLKAELKAARGRYDFQVTRVIEMESKLAEMEEELKVSEELVRNADDALKRTDAEKQEFAARLTRALRELKHTETARKLQEDECSALREQLLLLRCQLDDAKEERTSALAELQADLARAEKQRDEALAKLKDFSGDQKDWAIRFLVLVDELRDLEIDGTNLRANLHAVRKSLKGEKAKLNHVQLEMKELARSKQMLQAKLDGALSVSKRAATDLAVAKQDLVMKDDIIEEKDRLVKSMEAQLANYAKTVEVEVAKYVEMLEKETEKRKAAEKALRAAENALKVADRENARKASENERKHARQLAPSETQLEIMKGVVKEVEAELYRAGFALAKHGLEVPKKPELPKPTVNKPSSHVLLSRLATVFSEIKPGAFKTGEGPYEVQPVVADADAVTQAARRWNQKRKASMKEIMNSSSSSGFNSSNSSPAKIRGAETKKLVLDWRKPTALTSRNGSPMRAPSPTQKGVVDQGKPSQLTSANSSSPSPSKSNMPGEATAATIAPPCSLASSPPISPSPRAAHAHGHAQHAASGSNGID